MNFQPKSEREIAESRLWKKGEYSFEVVDASEKSSKAAGNEMIELKVKVIAADGTARVITDYLLAKRMEKLRHAAAACSALNRYEAGELVASDFAGKRGKLKLGVEKGKNGYPDRNIIADYVCNGAAASGSGFFAGNAKTA
jgi:hypothetical protein